MYALIMWSVIASTSIGVPVKDWKLLMEFNNITRCQQAIAQLGLNDTNARCVPK